MPSCIAINTCDDLPEEPIKGHWNVTLAMDITIFLTYIQAREES